VTLGAMLPKQNTNTKQCCRSKSENGCESACAIPRKNTMMLECKIMLASPHIRTTTEIDAEQ
jgi:hypothetical protein